MCRTASIAAWVVGLVATVCAAAEKVPELSIRVEARGFDASEADIRAVVTSAARELYRNFPDDKVEPIVVEHGEGSPITLFKRNERGEIVIRLATGRTYWSQYSYQFAHELCHVLCGYREGHARNKWFEETLCETASLYAMRGMARTWAREPPYPNWRDYRDALREYADDVIRKRAGFKEIVQKGMPGFYQSHRAELESDPCRRELNGAMAVMLLAMFEEKPERWESVRWLNSERPKDEGFREYLERWRAASPEKHRAFIASIEQLYGVTSPSTP